MTDITYIIALLILAGIIILQLFDRAKLLEQNKLKEDKLLEENSRLVKAIIAKNAHDYVMTTSIDKVAPEQKEPENPDLVDETELSDDEFINAVSKRNK